MTPAVPSDPAQLRLELDALQVLLGRLDISSRLGHPPPVTEAELAILSALQGLEHAKHGELARRTGLEGAWLSRNLKALMVRGLVQQWKPDAGKRGGRVDLTEAGKAAAATHRAALDALWQQAWEQLDPQARAGLAPAVRALNTAIKAVFDGVVARALGR